MKLDEMHKIKESIEVPNRGSKLRGNQNAKKDNPRDKTVTIRLTQGELRGVKRAAAASGVSYTKYARAAVLDAMAETLSP